MEEELSVELLAPESASDEVLASVVAVLLVRFSTVTEVTVFSFPTTIFTTSPFFFFYTLPLEPSASFTVVVELMVSVAVWVPALKV